MGPFFVKLSPTSILCYLCLMDNARLTTHRHRFAHKGIFAMFPLIPLISGIVIGAVGVRLLKDNQSAESLSAGLEKAESSLRRATISSFRKTSESLQNKLERGADAEPENESENTATDDVANTAPDVKDEKKL